MRDVADGVNSLNRQLTNPRGKNIVMVAKLLKGPHIRFMVDAMLGLAVFCGLTVVLVGPSSAASLLPISLGDASQALSAAHNFAGQMPIASIPSAFSHGGSNDSQSLIVLLAVVFSTLFALNLSFIRHIASAYRLARRPLKARAEPKTFRIG